MDADDDDLIANEEDRLWDIVGDYATEVHVVAVRRIAIRRIAIRKRYDDAKDDDNIDDDDDDKFAALLAEVGRLSVEQKTRVKEMLK